jgi:glycosyltransferase involved in cell wall biosynthesis
MKIKKIAIDVSPLYDGNSVRGVGYYTKYLVTALKEEIKTNPLYKNFRLDFIENPADLSKSKYDLIHYPFFDPFKLTLPPKKETPTIVTVHDLIPREFKKHFPVGLKGEIKWLIQKNRLKQSDFLITVSNYSKFVISDIIKYPADRIFVTYEAADPIFNVINNKKNLESVRHKYNLPSKFVLFVGDINWNKNVPGLVKACKELEIPLVIVGSAAVRKNVEKHPWNHDLLWLQQQKYPNLILTGYVSDEDLAAIYNLSTLYCQPSFAEGFGLPLIQAMQSGCPVACSNKTCLPEIVEDCALLFNPYSLKDIKKTINALWKSDTLRKEYSKRGIERASFFNWKFTAMQTLSVYQLALNDEK